MYLLAQVSTLKLYSITLHQPPDPASPVTLPAITQETVRMDNRAGVKQVCSTDGMLIPVRQ
ncbi:MAG TPA: hypothetical protein DEF05_11525 [Erwinia sp.]|nr:hypothetical protein [Erwinia sp.]